MIVGTRRRKIKTPLPEPIGYHADGRPLRPLADRLADAVREAAAQLAKGEPLERHQLRYLAEMAMLMAESGE